MMYQKSTFKINDVREMFMKVVKLSFDDEIFTMSMILTDDHVDVRKVRNMTLMSCKEDRVIFGFLLR